MTSERLAELLGPYVSPAARERVRALAMGAVSDISLRYDEVRDHVALAARLGQVQDEIDVWDGEERFIVGVRQ